MNFKKMSAKALSVFMSLLMLFSVLAPAVSAANWEHEHAHEGKEELNYVSLGDSMANGFGLSGYEYEYHKDGSEHTAECDCTDYKTWTEGNGYMQEVAAAYPSRFAAYLAGYTKEIKKDQNVFEGLFGKVTLSQMAMSSMRVEDINWILNADPAKMSDNWSDYAAYTDEAIEALCEEYNCDKYTAIEMLRSRLWDVKTEDGNNGSTTPASVITEYQNAIKNADVITIGSGNANFGVFMLHRLVAAMGLDFILGEEYHADAFTEDFDLDALLAQCDEKLVAEIEKFREEIKAELEKTAVDSFVELDNALDIVVYTTVSFCLNYESLLNTICTMNPNAEIIIVGLMKTVDGMNYVRANGEVIDLDEIMAKALGFANAYIAGYASAMQINSVYTNTIYYAEVPTVETIVANYEGYLRPENGEVNNVIRDRFVKSIVGTSRKPGMVWSTLGYTTYPTLADIEAFEANRAAYAAANSAMAEKIITYLAFEAAAIEATKGDINLDFATVDALKELGSVFTDEFKATLVPGTEYITEITLAHLKAGAPSGATGADKDIFTEIFRVIADNSLNTDLVGVLAKVFKQNNGEMNKNAHRKNVREFFKNYANLGAEGVVEKIIETLKADAWTEMLENGTFEALVAQVVAASQGMLSEEAAKAAVEVQAKIEIETRVEAMRATIEFAVSSRDEENPGLVYIYEQLYTVYVADAYASEALLADHTVATLINVFGRTLIGNGLGGHPSENGHDALFTSVKNAYMNEHTVIDETVDNIVILRDYIFENYDKFYAYAYEQAEKAGYIAQIDAYLVEAINAVRYAENWANGYEEYFRSEDFADQITASADSTVASIEALRAVIANADHLDAELNATIVALAAQVESNLKAFAALINIAAADAYAYGAPIVEAEVAKALAFINEKVNAVLEAIAYVEAKVQEQIAIAEALLEKFVAIAAPYLDMIFGEAVKTEAEVKAKIAEAEAYLNSLIKVFLSHSAHTADYTVSADSYYLAIGGDDALYAELLAEKIGLNAEQFGTMGWNDIDATTIAKADLITIGYTESMISGFAVEQIRGFVAEYINGTLKGSVEGFAYDALKHFFAECGFNNFDPTMYVASIDEMLSLMMTMYGLDEAETTEMDWAALVGEENAAYVDEALKFVTGALIEAGLPETFTYDIEISVLVEALAETDPMVAAIVASLGHDELVAKFGEYATYTLELPVADFAKFAVESYLYSNVKFNVEYAQLVYLVNAINPNAQIVLLGNYDVFSGLGMDLEIVVDEKVISLSDIFTAEIKDSANSYTEEVFNKIFGTLDNALDSDKIDSALGSVDSAIISGASTLYEIILGILADAEDARDYINGTEIVLPEIPELPEIPACPELEIVLGMISKLNPDALTDIDWVKLVGFDATGIVVAVANVINNVIDNAVEVVETALEEYGLIETVTITLPTLDLIYANLDKFDAETRALIESLNQAELRAMLGDLAEYVVEVKTATTKAIDYVNGIYDQIAGIEITVFEGFDATIDLGTILSAPSSIHGLIYAYTMENVIFVDISGAEIASEATSIADFIVEYLLDNTAADLSEAGHAYVAEQIYAALNIVHTEHYDLDKDHKCDCCGEVLSACADDDNDHYCDYCGAELSACADNTNDHKCDVCGKVLSECADANNDHKCDVCGAELSKCADNNNDHKCDVCGAELNKCADANNDHKCDVCGKVLSECADANNDHKCDVCGKVLSECADANNDHKCDVCGKVLSECADANNDHKCDVCGTVLSECADANNDHKCDICGNVVSECADNNKDHKCDICGKVISECQFGEWVVTKEATKKEAGERQRTCSICGAVETEVIAQLEGLSTGAIVAIVAGSIVVAAGIGVGIYFGIKTGFFANVFASCKNFFKKLFKKN